MKDYQKEFIEFAIKRNILRFGEFTLKSGRISPYFFNSGLFSYGSDLAHLGRFYAHRVSQANLEFDILFGPAYKGIPLVAATAIALSEKFKQDIGYAFNRKEPKDHGEGGTIIGASLNSQKVLIVDDVISAGTSVRESVTLIKDAGGILTGVVISLDRQERGKGTQSAAQEITTQYGIPVISIASLTHLITYLSKSPTMEQYLDRVKVYRDQYGIE
ncbi:orotate phosphoribosyltransferase [Candidatus Nitrosacidococcus tergens]|uniref:Orotate phosphoribosyltransferase n=1 Tax=Candidatus Nitrosacidococcus tergens TaxID=553981 RepID=A0A7G1QBW7_9GAMM|nr:orotate phosphoribosyltransferase [Candidatus Nitrosacidococcus tergens]CAB1277493.1 orotate phosphoribosyltransferase [Candidatus Nitrosacidococcus tergens]